MFDYDDQKNYNNDVMLCFHGLLQLNESIDIKRSQAAAPKMQACKMTIKNVA
jgi:hypothetical protein